MNQKHKRRLRKLTEDGLPRDANEWTEDDWRELWRLYREAVRRIGERHKERENETGSV
jgi:sugar (pentulose or hexulose) kinase